MMKYSQEITTADYLKQNNNIKTIA